MNDEVTPVEAAPVVAPTAGSVFGSAIIKLVTDSEAFSTTITKIAAQIKEGDIKDLSGDISEVITSGTLEVKDVIDVYESGKAFVKDIIGDVSTIVQYLEKVL